MVTQLQLKRLKKSGADEEEIYAIEDELDKLRGDKKLI